MNRFFLFLTALAATLTAALGATAALPLPPLPHAATSFGATISEGRVYVYGGNTGRAHEFHKDCVKGDFFALTVAPEAGAWETLVGGEGLLSCSLVAVRDGVLRIGGMNARNAKDEPNDLHSTAAVERFDPKTGKWSAAVALPEPRSSHDAILVGETIYVGGGWKLDGHSNGDWHKTMLSLDLAHPEKGWQERPQTFERRALAMVYHAGKIWFLGGMNSHDEPSLEVDCFDPATGQWSKGPELPDGPMKGFGLTACEQEGKLYISPVTGTIYTLSEDGAGWREAAHLKSARFFHRLLPVAGGGLLAVGGSGRQGHVLEVEMVQPTLVQASSWPQWRGPRRDGITAETLRLPGGPPPLLWQASVGAGMTSPVLADGKVILHGSDGEGTDSVRALSVDDGREIWHYGFPAAAVAHEMRIVPAGPAATPTVEGGRVFALSRDGTLLCLKLADGKLIWRADLVTGLGAKRPVYGYAQSPLVDQGRVVLDLGAAAGAEGSTAALDAATGQVLWRSGQGEAGYSAARVLERDGRHLVAMFKGEAMELLDPRDGKIVWSYRSTARDFCNAATPVFVGEKVLVTNTGNDPAALLEWATGGEPNVHAAWTNRQFAQLFNSAIPYAGCLFAFNERKRGQPEFTCLDAQTGETRWVSDAVPTGTFVLAGTDWIFLTRDGEVVVAPASAAELKPSYRFPALTGKCYATPALCDGRLIVRNNEGEVRAYDFRAPKPAPSAP